MNSGLNVPLDDFGSGFSSLGLLKEFDVDTIKLDRRFFLDMSKPKAEDVVECLIDLAGRLKVKTVAEGIETQEQIDFLKQIHCDMVQGFFYSRPLRAEEFEEWQTDGDKKEGVADGACNGTLQRWCMRNKKAPSLFIKKR